MQQVVTDIPRSQIPSEFLKVMRSWMKLRPLTRCHSELLSSTQLCCSRNCCCLSITPTWNCKTLSCHFLFFNTTSSQLWHRPQFLNVCFQFNGIPPYQRPERTIQYLIMSPLLSQPHPSANIPENTLDLPSLPVYRYANSGTKNSLL